jgi:hypothetical protein
MGIQNKHILECDGYNCQGSRYDPYFCGTSEYEKDIFYLQQVIYQDKENNNG